MRHSRVASLAGVFCLAGCVGSRSGAIQGFTLAPGDVWIQDVTLISAERSVPLPHAHVVLRRDRIAWVGAPAPNGRAAGTTVIQGAGRYLVPGLIDGHVHLAAVPGMADRHRAAMPGLVAAYYQQLPRSYLYFGFTTVVDLNVAEAADRQVVDRVRAADLAPAVLDCGSALMLANGYPMLNRPSPARFQRYPNFLYDPRQASSIPPEYAAGEHTPEAAVARVAAGGGVCVKAFYEPGPPERPFPVPTLEMMREVREASHRRGLPLLLHANSLEAHRFATELRPDVVAHGLWNWKGAHDGVSGELPAEVRAVLDSERRLGIGYMATLRVLSGLGDLFAPGFLDDEHLARVVPPALLAWYRSPEGQWCVDDQNDGRLPAERMRALFMDPSVRLATKEMAQRGGRILFGSDTPSDAIYSNPPGYNGYLEMRELEAAGLSPRQILASATLEDARLFGIQDRYGTIQAGKVASLLLLRDDPLASTSAFDTIETVLVRGRVVPRASLAADAK